MTFENWIRFDGYEGRLDPAYKGAYSSVGLRYPFVERTRTWDIVRVSGEPTARRYRRGDYTILSRGHDMMKKAHEEAAAYRLHFKGCQGVGVCADIGHPGGPKRSASQRLTTTANDPEAPPDDDMGSIPDPDGTPLMMPISTPMAGDPDDWVSALMPSGELRGRVVVPGFELRVIPLTFALWPGPPLGMGEDCNKRGGRVIGDQGDLSCAEVEIVKRLRNAGWGAAWYQSFKCGRRRWSAYVADGPALPPVVQRIQHHAGMAGGHPDVIGWRGERVIVVESKSPTDRLKPSQIEWFSRAIEFGVRPDDIAVVEWRVH